MTAAQGVRKVNSAFCFFIFVFSITFLLGKNPLSKIHFKPLLRHYCWDWLHFLLSTWFKWTIIYTEGWTGECHSPRTSSVLEALIDRVLKDRHWKHDLLQTNASQRVHIVRNYSWRDGSCNRSACGRSTWATQKALHALQFLWNAWISSSAFPMATVEMIHFHRRSQWGAVSPEYSTRLQIGPQQGRLWTQAPSGDDLLGFCPLICKSQIKSLTFRNFFDHLAEDSQPGTIRQRILNRCSIPTITFWFVFQAAWIVASVDASSPSTVWIFFFLFTPHKRLWFEKDQ